MHGQSDMLKPGHILGILAAALFGMSFWQRKNIMAAIDGVDKTPPEQLAKAAGVSLDTYSLARAAQNEESSEKGRIAVMWAIKNMAKKSGVSPTRLITRATKKDAKTGKTIPLPHDGFYARQNAGGKYCASFNAPSAKVIELAKQIEAGTIKDPTGGAIQWDNPIAQDKMYKSGVKGYSKNAAMVAADRIAAGRKLVNVPGVSTRFWA